MTIGYWLNVATTFLQSKAITTARLDCMVLLADTLQQDKAWVLAYPEYELSEAAVAHLQQLLAKRAQHLPLAYIRGRAEFYGRTFVITPAVLVPRPESEAMVELLLGLDICAQPSETPLTIADIGAGSGALGITAALELKTRGFGPRSLQTTLIELDDAALKISTRNVDAFATHSQVLKSDLLAQASEPYDILLCNLPYVPDSYPINKAATHEPAIALFAGSDGLDLYRRLFEQIATLAQRPAYVLAESLPEQHQALTAIAAAHGYELQKTADFIQQFASTPL